MQQITYVNILGEEAVLGMAPPYLLHSVAGTGTTSATITSIQGVYQSGESIRRMLRDARHVDCKVSIKGATRREMYDNRRALAAIMAAGKGIDEEGNTGRIYYKNDAGEWWTEAVPETGVGDMADRVGNWQRDVSISFRCPSAWWHSIEEYSIVYDFTTNGLTLPFDLPFTLGNVDYTREIRNGGQVAAPVTIIIQGHGETPRLVNEDTGAAIELTSQLPEGTTLEINTDQANLYAQITDATGTHNAFGVLNPSLPVTDFVLRPGLNRVRYDPTGEASGSVIEMRWRNHYEGV